MSFLLFGPSLVSGITFNDYGTFVMMDSLDNRAGSMFLVWQNGVVMVI